MKRTLFTALMGLVIMFSLASTAKVAAVNVFRNCPSTVTASSPDVCKDVKNPGSNNPIVRVIKDVINVVSFAVGIASVIIIIVSGLRLVINGGDPKAVEQARSGIIYALAGIAVTLMAQTIVVFVLNKIG